MLFNSKEFILLVLLTFLIYYIPVFASVQVLVLIVSSIVFYAFNSPALLYLLLTSILMNVFVSYILNSGFTSRKVYATVGVVGNLLILVFFKYSPLIGASLFPGENSIGQFLIMIPLPIGISFYTFQGISLVVDSYKKNIAFGSGKSSFQTHLYKTAFFIMFFPQLIAGPIVKAKSFFPQIKTKFFKNIELDFVVEKVVTGYFLKVVIAENLASYTSELLVPEYHSSATLLFLLFAYSIQIFADFAGYSLIAIGISAMFGYRLINNFNFPYISRSFSEFWTRWHISLSSFLKEYLYIPLGGNRKGNARTYFNLFIVMFLGGLWHGASWTYAIWGCYHGVLLGAERLWKDVQKKNVKEKKLEREVVVETAGLGFRNVKFVKTAFSVFIVFSFVTAGWILFRIPTLHGLKIFLKSLFSNLSFFPILNYALIIPIIVYSIPVLLYHLIYLYMENEHESADRYFSKIKPILLSIMLFLIVVSQGQSGSFIYFQF